MLGSATPATLPAHAHLQAGGRRPAVRQHPGEHGPHGAQIKAVLEQQWQTNPGGRSARPFLRLGSSKGFELHLRPATPQDIRITQMWLNGMPIDPATSYSVTVNSFLASGGDNFFGLHQRHGASRTPGKTDLQAMVDYMAEFANTGAGDPPLPVTGDQQPWA